MIALIVVAYFLIGLLALFLSRFSEDFKARDGYGVSMNFFLWPFMLILAIIESFIKFLVCVGGVNDRN